MLYQKFLHFGVKMALKNGWVGLSNTVCFSSPFPFSLFILPLPISAVEADKLSMGGS